MVQVEPFKKEHVERIKGHDSQAGLLPYFSPQAAAALEADGMARTIFSDGRPVFCGGVYRHWAGRGEAWGWFDQECKQDFLRVHHEVRRFLDECPVKRIEAVVETTFVAGHRWVRSLGFKIETPVMAAYLPPGKDATMYVRVRG